MQTSIIIKCSSKFFSASFILLMVILAYCNTCLWQHFLIAYVKFCGLTEYMGFADDNSD